MTRDEYLSMLTKGVKPKNKFRAKKTTVGDTQYASKKEARMCEALKLRERAGEITHLELQPKFDLLVNGRSVGKYIADASFRDLDGTLHVQDAKGGNATKTPVYRLKRRLMKAIYNIDIEEV